MSTNHEKAADTVRDPLPASGHVTPDADAGATDQAGQRARTAATVTLAVIACLAVLSLGRVLFLPLATAIMLSLVLRPISRRLHHFNVPYPLSSLMLVLLITAAGAATVHGLREPAAQWLEEAPYSLRLLEFRLIEFTRTLEEVRAATEQVGKLGEMAAAGAELEVVVEKQGLLGQLVVEVRDAATGVFMTVIMLFFVLGWGERVYRNLVNALPRFANQRRTVEIAQEIEESVATYLSTITLINLALGVVVAGVLFLLGMPNPVLWGVMAAVLNYIPYLGPAVTAAVLSFVALITYPTIGEALLVPLVFLGITSIEGYVLTPMAIGSRLTLNPLVIFLSLVFWFWIWGIIGGLLTVPLLVCLKVMLEHLAGHEVARILD